MSLLVIFVGALQSMLSCVGLVGEIRLLSLSWLRCDHKIKGTYIKAVKTY